MFPWLITLYQHVPGKCGRKWLISPLNGATQSVDIEEKGRSSTLNRECMAEIKRVSLYWFFYQILPENHTAQIMKCAFNRQRDIIAIISVLRL